MIRPLDDTDIHLISELDRQPRASLAELARAVGVARGTVYSRLERLENEGVIAGYGPEIDPSKAGFDVTAFCTLDIVQGSLHETTTSLSEIPEILEIHTVTGVGDLHLKIVARSNDHLHDVLQRIAAVATVTRSQTQLALSTSLHRNVINLLTESPRRQSPV